MSDSESNKTKEYGESSSNMETSIMENSVSSISSHSGGYQPLQPGDIGITIGNQSFTIDSTNPLHSNVLAAVNFGKASSQIPDINGITPPRLERNLTNENLNDIYTNLNTIIGSVGRIYNSLNSSSSNSSSSNSSNPNPNSSNSSKK